MTTLSPSQPLAQTSLFRNKIYTRVYCAYAAATFGDWFDTLAIQVLVGYRWGVSPLMLALIPVVNALPSVLLGSFAGVAADRLNKLKLMRICDLLTAVLTLLVIFAPSMLWLLPLLMLRAVLSTFIVPAQQSLTRSIVREDQLLQATSWNGIVNQGSKIAGPLLGGFALSLLSPQWCILLNVFFRMGSYFLLLTVRNAETAGTDRAIEAVKEKGHPSETSSENKIPLRTMWKEGWGLLLQSRLLLATMGFGLIGALVIQMIDFQFTSLFRTISPNQESYLGWMVAASGAGAILMIMALNKIKRTIGYGWKFGLGYALIGVPVGALGLLPHGVSVLPILLLGFILGLGNGLFMVTFNYCLQKETPPSMVGRVFGIQSTILGVVMIGAPLLGGLFVEMAGPERIFFCFGAAIALLGLFGILFGRVLWPAAKVQEKGDPAKETAAEI